ncbi:MAG TPA: hypothetical protein VFA21_10605 [Pyrinomonadaceae bacterium]|jgi:hypothetical protein|nr:hypothetical protein [Pyrinomonadaceae bacterium]
MLKNQTGESKLLLALKWAGRALSVFSVGVLLLFFVGEGFDPSEVTPRQWAALLLFPFVVVAGMLIAWRREGLGGGVSVAGLAAFYLYSLLLNGGTPRGLAFLILSAPGFLFLFYGLARQLTRPHKQAGLHA